MLLLLAPVAVIVSHVDNGAWTDAPTEARIDQKAELAVVVVDGNKVLAPGGITKVTLAGKQRMTKPLAPAKVQWSIIEPHGFRTKPAANGATSDFYSNVSTESKSFGKWLGYDQIEYFERVVRAWGDTKPIVAKIATADDATMQVPGLGTLHYKAEVKLGDRMLATAGAEATDTFGLLPSVHRVSIRRDDTFLGFLSEYLLVPEVFGSAGGGRNHQTERFTGADCADVMVGAMRRKGTKKLAYTNVAGLPSYAKTVTGAVELDENGMPSHEIAGVQVGDLIRIDYGGELRNHTPRAFDHVAALWEDKSDPNGPQKGRPDGKLDGFDLVIHMGHPRLKIEPLSGQSPATIDVLRWKTQK